MSITEFLAARIAEDEAASKAILDHFYGEGRWEWNLYRPRPSKVALVDERGVLMVETILDGPTWMVCDHIARYDPARVLAECAAKRRIVEMHWATTSSFLGREITSCCAECSPEGNWDSAPDVPHPCPTLRILASVYADHPDYRREWA
jgi:hypothetical protein